MRFFRTYFSRQSKRNAERLLKATARWGCRGRRETKEGKGRGTGRRSRLACAYLNSNMARIQLIRRVSQIHFHYCNFRAEWKKATAGVVAKKRAQKTRQCAGKVSQREEATELECPGGGRERESSNSDTCRPRHLHMQLTHACGKPAANMQTLQQCAKKSTHTTMHPSPPPSHSHTHR